MIKHLLKLAVVLLAANLWAADPGVIFNASSTTLCARGVTQLCALPTAKVRVCPYSYTNPPYSGQCSNPVTLYTDPTLVTTTGNPVSADYLGNANIFTNPGEYILQYISVTGSVLYQQPISSNGGGGAGTSAPLSGLTDATTNNSVLGGDFMQTWKWRLITNGNFGLNISESAASTATNSALFNISTLSSSSARPFQATAQGTANGVYLSTAGVLQSMGTGQVVADTTKLTINTTSPLSGGGALNANLTLSCPNCVTSNSSNSYTAGPQDLNTFAQTIQVANDTVTGTLAMQLAKVTSTGAKQAAVTDTATPVYIVDSGAGTAGNAKLAITGIESCVFDSNVSNAAGYFVVASTTTAGYCHAQSATPSGLYVVGTMISNSTTTGTSSSVAVSRYLVNTAGGGSGVVSSGTSGQMGGYTATGTTIVGLPNFTFSNGQLTFGQAGSVQGSACFSGSTSGTHCLAVPAGASGTSTFQAVSDTLVYRATTDTLTNKTYNAESAGNLLSIPVKAYFAAAGCNNATAGNSWDIGTANQPTPACQGSNSRKGVLQFARGNTAYINFELPFDWNSGASVDLKIVFTTTDTTNGHITAFNVQTACSAEADNKTDDPTFNTAQTASATQDSSAVAGGTKAAALTGLTMTGCSTGNNFIIAITRNNSGTDTNTDTGVAVKFATLTFGRSMNAANR